jgi:hypothetical protein
MNESFARLSADPRNPQDDLPRLIRDIRAILIHQNLTLDQKIIAVGNAVDTLAPPPPPGPATRLALRLRQSGRPFTLLAAELTGEEVQVKLTSQADRPPAEPEARLLRTREGTVRCRSGTLYLAGSGLVVAEVTSTVIMTLLPEGARAALDGDTPLGAVLAGLPGAQREPLEARETSDGQVISSALMWSSGRPVALASEVITTEFIGLVEP